MEGPSPHLSWAELACKDEPRTPYPEEFRAIRGLRLGMAYEIFRQECGGKPLYVLSGYRTKEHNAAIGGASRSQHQHGNGIDVANPLHLMYGAFVSAAFRARERVPDLIKGIGIYPGRRSIHLDVREAERLAVWTG